MKFTHVLMLLLFSFAALAPAQTLRPDSAFYAEMFIWDKTKTIFTMDFSKIEKPESPESFNPLFHFPPVRQDTTGTCWAFSATSFLESEIYRLHNKKIKLSEMYPVYWEYVEKARRFIRERGDSYFAQGSEEDALLLRMKTYGAVRADDYTGLTGDARKHNHKQMFREMNGYLRYIKSEKMWDEEMALAYIRSILDKYMGLPPEKIKVGKSWMTPVEFLKKEARLPLDDYVSLMSFKSQPFYKQGEYKVPDNWWHAENYYNVPLDDWYEAILRAVQNGYTIGIGGDVSEPGKGRRDDVCIVPTFDIPEPYINQDAREYRFTNKSSTDDHGIHLIGHQQIGEHDWFLIKDSSSSANEGNFKGYYFYREDFIKLKMLTFIVHQEAVKDLLDQCQHGKD